MCKLFFLWEKGSRCCTRQITFLSGPLFPYLLSEGFDSQVLLELCLQMALNFDLRSLVPGPCSLSPPGCVGAKDPICASLLSVTSKNMCRGSSNGSGFASLD